MPTPARARDDRDRELRASARRRTRNPGSREEKSRYQAAPTGNPSSIATSAVSPRPPPALHVERDRPGALAGSALLPVVGVVEHVAQEADVLRSSAPETTATAQSASAGCSTSATSVRRNSAPSAPSIARWSHVSISCMTGAMSISPSTTTGVVLHRADGEDRHLRRVEHGDELLDPVHAEVGDREGPALEILQRQLAVARTARRGRRATRAISWIVSRSAFGDHGDDQAVAGAATAIPTLAAAERWISSPVNVAFTAGWRVSATATSFVEDVVHRRLHVTLGEALDEPLPQRERLGHLGGDAELEDGRLPRLGQPARDRLPHRRQLDDLHLGGRCGAASRAPRRGAADRGLLHVLGDDPPIGPGARAPPARSTPRSRASRRASGEAFSRPSRPLALDGARAGGSPRAGSLGRCGSGLADRSRAPPSAGGASGRLGGRPGRPRPPVPMHGDRRPTSTSPSSTTIFSRTPSASASTSCVTLSVSSS